MIGKYKLYAIRAKAHYHGIAIVSAETAEKAKKIVDTFQFYDSDNASDSKGWETDITEDDALPYAFGTSAGIVFNSIYYWG